MDNNETCMPNNCMKTLKLQTYKVTENAKLWIHYTKIATDKKTEAKAYTLPPSLSHLSKFLPLPFDYFCCCQSTFFFI